MPSGHFFLFLSYALAPNPFMNTQMCMCDQLHIQRHAYTHAHIFSLRLTHRYALALQWSREAVGGKGCTSWLQIAEEILAMQISLTPEQIQDLANKINATIQGLQNIDAILDATRDNLTLAQNLKRQADAAS